MPTTCGAGERITVDLDPVSCQDPVSDWVVEATAELVAALRGALEGAPPAGAPRPVTISVLSDRQTAGVDLTAAQEAVCEAARGIAQAVTLEVAPTRFRVNVVLGFRDLPEPVQSAVSFLESAGGAFAAGATLDVRQP